MIRLASKKSMAKDTEAEYSKWSYGRFMTLRKRKAKINAEIKEKGPYQMALQILMLVCLLLDTFKVAIKPSMKKISLSKMPRYVSNLKAKLNLSSCNRRLK